jgi:hypothetical protein
LKPPINGASPKSTLNSDESFFTTRPLLWKLRRKIDDRIEPILVEKSRDDSGFLDEITRTGIIIK